MAENSLHSKAQTLNTPISTYEWRGRDIFYFIITFLALNVGAVSLVNILPFEGEHSLAMKTLFGTLFVELALIGVTALTFHFVHHRNFMAEMRWSRKYEANNITLLLLGAGLAITVMIVSTLFPSSNPPIERMLNTPASIALFAVFGLVFAPFLEEMMFRGFLFRAFEALFTGTIAVRLTAFLFALMHVPQLWGSWAGMIVIFGVGYALSELRQHTGSVMPSVIVHTAYNGTLFLVYILSTFFQ